MKRLFSFVDVLVQGGSFVQIRFALFVLHICVKVGCSLSSLVLLFYFFGLEKYRIH